jgi:predicted DNA binding CopG/RHH family protein
MKKVPQYTLDEEETALLNDFKAGEFQPIPNQQEEIQKIKTYLQAKHNKVKRVNIRVTEEDFLAA